MAKQKIEVWVDEDDLARIDQVRGLAPRSAWAREILHDAVTDGPIHHGVPDIRPGDKSRLIPPTTKPSQRPRPNPPVPDQHRHRYVNDADPVRFDKGTPVYIRRCACGSITEGS